MIFALAGDADTGSMVVVWLAAIAVVGSLVTSVVAPMVMASVQNRHRREEKEEDWKRQDEVAKRAKEASDQQQAVLAVIDGKVNAIHTLTNAEKTAAIERQLDGAKTQLAMLREIKSLKGRAGKGTLSASDAAILTLQQQIEVMEADLVERARQTAVAEAQLRASAGLPADASVPAVATLSAPPTVVVVAPLKVEAPDGKM